MVFINGTGDTVNVSGGNEAITDTVGSNTYVLPRAGNGSDNFASNIFNLSDTLDLRTALAATTWNGSASTLANYVTVSDSIHVAVLSIATTSGGTPAVVATIADANTATLSNIMPHLLT